MIKSQYKTEYAYMLDKLYPAVRRVDFLFSLSRRGMRQDTLYTNEPDTMYARAVDYLEKRKYGQALDVSSTLAVSNIRNRTYTNYEVYLIGYGYGKFKEKIHFME